ncbi:MAG: PilW family protein [Gammaproteobacteria bacterium]
MSAAGGFTLVELMLAIFLGGLLLTGFVSLHGQSGAIVKEVELTAELQDTARLALAYLETDLLQAGFFGSIRDADAIAGVAGPDEPVTVSVAGDCGPNFSLDLSQAIAGRNGSFDLACTPFSGRSVAGADVLIVRRAGSRARERDPTRLQLATALSSGQLLAPEDSVSVGGGAGDPVTVRDLVVCAYYVSERSSGGVARPSLRRKLLGAGPRMADEEVAPGVSDLQLQFGIDLDLPGDPGSGSADLYVHADDPRLQRDARVAAVRVWLMIEVRDPNRPPGRPVPGYADRAASGPDQNKRLLVSRTYPIANLLSDS